MNNNNFNNFTNNGFNSNLHSEIITFDIPGIKIIVIPTFFQTNNSEIFTIDIPGPNLFVYLKLILYCMRLRVLLS
ncbi:hypothetical protein RhiirA5_412116 [Rhizophagus irregularis]|uniref:Uncharacterized protein n=1 Tax=Rhizophagus irregularis TaxID=588596 RepID=A0A2N0PZD3_9GLOM|nr:hypothetical protein RhiirA5_412116 [Rhizophagus irregularis]GET55294.1 hypothetical protein GLOIN_2v1785237 [Rhizophagus irregularis DAOM 181602=DAOM 197198]